MRYVDDRFNNWLQAAEKETRHDDVSHKRLQKNADGLRPPLEFITSLDV